MIKDRFFQRSSLWLSMLLLLGTAGFLVGLQSIPDPAAAGLSETLQRHVKYLASEKLAGRGTGLAGNRRAADYIAEHFREYGLASLSEDYRQEFRVTTQIKLEKGNSVKVQHADKSYEWEHQRDFRPLWFSGSKTATGEAVFVGYGISAGEQGFDEYASLDVEGKIVIVLRSSPDHNNPHGGLSRYAPLIYKLRNAREQGAAAIIYVSPSDLPDQLITLRMLRGAGTGRIPAVHARREAIDRLLPEGLTVTGLEEEIKSSRRPHSLPLPGVRLTVRTDLQLVEESTQNVIGLVPGSDPLLAQEYLVVGAHFDHLGWGDRGGSRYRGEEPAIHYGADDNASGTAAMLELARAVAQQPLPRSVLFMGFSAEELGLHGSAYFCDHPLVPLENIVTMINLDMIGRMRDQRIDISGTGTSARWPALLDSLGEVYRLNLAKSPEGYGPSDHASFYARDIPVINFFSGFHGDYHTPGDTWEKLNYQGLATLTLFTEDLLRDIGAFRERPDFVNVSEQEEAPGENPQGRIMVGTIPDYAEHPRGLRISRVQADSPAEKGGLLAGDVIVRFGDTAIRSVEDYQSALGKYAPRDTVEVVVLRGAGEKRVSVKLTLEAGD